MSRTTDLEQAYRNTEYRFCAAETIFCLRIGQANPELDQWLGQQNQTAVAYISNCNPAGRPLSEKANTQRTAALQRWLLRQGLVHWPGLGVPGPDSDWLPEPSFAICGLTLDAARAICRHCEQLAFVWHEAGQVSTLCWQDEYS